MNQPFKEIVEILSTIHEVAYIEIKKGLEGI